AVDGNGRLCRLDPRLGAALAVAEAARNVACVGARPIGLTNCLNFGSPEDPGVMWQFREAVEGLREASLALDVPVTGGNVSFYNETAGKPIHPTPVVGVVGLLEDAAGACPTGFRAPGDRLYLLGPDAVSLGGSEYAWLYTGRAVGRPQGIDLDLERRLQALLVEAAAARLLRSAHDLSEGGLAAAAAECCLLAAPAARGARLDLPGAGARADVVLFGEGPSRVLVSTAPEASERLEAAAARWAVPCRLLGEVGGDRLRVSVDGRLWIDVSLKELEKAWREALPCRMG
ncbi:MAG: phosphoribosylformylglycinamidine synthase II, partial [Clostridia bacterium]|nr:phosphoribosylformylglycinamidine synthase II [Clostridia bacterium]